MPYVGAEKMRSISKPKRMKPPGTNKRVGAEVKPNVPPGLQDKGGMPPGQMKKALPDERRQSQGVVSPISPRVNEIDQNGYLQGLLKSIVGDRDNFGQAGPSVGFGVEPGIPSPVGPQRSEGGGPMQIPNIGWQPPQNAYPTQSGPPFMQDQGIPQMQQLLEILMQLRGGGGMQAMIPPGLQAPPRGGGMRPMIPPGLQSGRMNPSQPRGIPFNPGIG